MSDQNREEHFDLARFVLGYLAEKGSIVAPAAFGVHEVLLPELLAGRLKIESYLNLRFGAEESRPDEDDSLRLSVNHPLVDRLADELLKAGANSQVFINHLRLDKKGLLEQAEKNIGIANARLSQKKGAMEQQALHHYLRFNFKVTFVSDEKQEFLVSIVMDAQNGYAITDAQHLQRLLSTGTTPGYPHMSVAPPRWLGAGAIDAAQTYQALLERAQKALESQLSPRMIAMQQRIQRFLELDQARIKEYYDALEADLRRRLERAESSESGRGIKGNQEKLAAVQGERTAKLSDIHARYQLRLEIELVNVQRIVQPKVMLPVEIGDRRLTVTRYVVWDPLLHELEALVCDVCGQPGENLHLCTGGHLAHEECLSPQCIDCKREYCQRCAEQVQTCVVCGEPVCRPSLITCPQCKRGTCREHQGLCHAADGQLAVLTPTKTEVVPTTPAVTPSPPTRTVPTPKTGNSVRPAVAPAAKSGRTAKSTTISKKSQPIRPGQRPQKPKTTAKHVQVLISATEPVIVVRAMRTSSRPYATRTIKLQPNGISVHCECEKEKCPANGWIHRPHPTDLVPKQIEQLVGRVQTEYNFPASKVEYYMLYALDRRPLHGFTLPPVWLDEVRLELARQGFDAEK
ncbi:MAG: hypothetical protein KF753_00565 [Caldilineaceae bacterium]|nr:hypothetical protein [Caldilineaceae bacterium]